MLFRQVLHEPLAAASYLLGCSAAGTAVVVDPSLPAADYVLLAANRGLRIVAVLETHMHADYVSTGRALAALTGSALCIPRLAEATFPHTPVDEGWEYAAGNVLLRAMHTPGHTPEHMAYLVIDQGRTQQPWVVLTGDCLFVGDVGRADLLDLPQSGAEYLYHSVRRLLDLPDDIEVYPTHYGGSACGGKGMSGKPSSTVGFERRENAFARAHDLAAFRRLLDDTPRDAVDSVLHNRTTNRGELALPDSYGALPDGFAAIPTITLADALAAQATGAAIIDLRDRLLFAQNHLSNALSITYSRDALAGRVAALTAADQPLILLAEPPLLANYAGVLLAEQARNPVLGYLATSEWLHHSTEGLAIGGIAELQQAAIEGTTLILDVRSVSEQANGVIAGAIAIPYGEVRTKLATLPHDKPIVVVCESGIRAVGIASLLCQQGFNQVAAIAPQGMSDYWRFEQAA